MEQSKAILKQHNLKVTHARTLVLALFLSVHKPCSMTFIVDTLKKELIDLSTLYRTIEAFEAAGIIRAVRGNGKSILYEYVSIHTHHHLVCTKCDEVEEVAFNSKLLQQKVLASSKKFITLDTGTIELFGTCISCKK